MKLSAHLGYQFNEVPFLERFELAARYGYRAVEFPAPYGYAVSVLKNLMDAHELKLVQISAPMGNTAAGEKGIASFAGRRDEFVASVSIAREAALALGCPRVHIMAGVRTDDAAGNWDAYVENLQRAVETFSSVGIKTLVEVMSPQEVPGYLMSSFEQAEALFSAIPNRNLELLFDTYHAAVLEPDLLATLEHWLPRIGHIQISDFPGRHEPGTGALPFDQIFSRLKACGYQHWVGCEYRPLCDTVGGLRYLAAYLDAPGS
ncbi:TIM barrel protein [Paraburkholderia sp. Tr-20389]|uniref:hydroxypyruvate isomerase family protein n=1 Tax=Paraburkholderia sp. Tr-20389 TaxID=2703903 RepID=UPI00197CFAD3|nr:TIM barrel protein [Paraburkholderia sp. Tr-20389]MBN3754775.1 TIM barrel protein [Paraburkholderia sp. Tr-20389]